MPPAVGYRGGGGRIVCGKFASDEGVWRGGAHRAQVSGINHAGGGPGATAGGGSETAERSGISECVYDVLPTLYNAADFSMCPSLYDPFPFVVSEALASGTPVIASPHGASLTYYTDDALKPLLTASTDDLEGFEKAVRDVISDPQKWRD